MAKRALLAIIPAALAGTFGLQSASADVYTWVDAKGTINVSNVAPPPDARVINFTRESAASREASAEAARAREVQALAERVRQLEQEVETAKNQAAEREYRAMSPPPAPPVAWTPPIVQYQIVQVPAANSGCDAGWAGCTPWGFAPISYPTSVVVLQAPSFHRPRPPHRSLRPPSFGPVRPLTGFPRS